MISRTEIVVSGVLSGTDGASRVGSRLHTEFGYCKNESSKASSFLRWRTSVRAPQPEAGARARTAAVGLVLTRTAVSHHVT